MAAHLGVIEVANLTQVLPGHHPQPDGQALAQQPQDGGPQQHPQQLGGDRREGGSRGWALGRIRQPSAPSKVIHQPGDTGEEKPRGAGGGPQPRHRGWLSRTPGCPPPVPRAPPFPVPFPLPGLGKPACHGAGWPLAQEGLRNPWLLPDAGAGVVGVGWWGSRAHLEPRHRPALQVRLHIARVQVGDAHEEPRTSESPEFPKAETGLGGGSRSERGGECAPVQNQRLPVALPVPFNPLLRSPVLPTRALFESGGHVSCLLWGGNRCPPPSPSLLAVRPPSHTGTC